MKIGTMGSPGEDAKKSSKPAVKKKAASAKKKSVKYCKAPQAPRRFKSPFIIYSETRHPQIRGGLMPGEARGDKTTHVAKLVSAEWRNLTPDQRAPFEEQAQLDKERYEVEKSMYAGPWTVPAKSRSKKDPSAPKRPMSSFLSFSNAKRGELKSQNPGMTNTEASKVLAKMWKDAPEEEKREHIEREAKLREVYKVEIAEWRNRKKEEEEELRRKREEIALNIIASRGGIGVKRPPGEVSHMQSEVTSEPENSYAKQSVTSNVQSEHRWHREEGGPQPFQTGIPMHLIGQPPMMYGYPQPAYGQPPPISLPHSHANTGQPPIWQGQSGYYLPSARNFPGHSYYPPTHANSQPPDMHGGYAPYGQTHHFQRMEMSPAGDERPYASYPPTQQPRGGAQPPYLPAQLPRGGAQPSYYPTQQHQGNPWPLFSDEPSREQYDTNYLQPPADFHPEPSRFDACAEYGEVAYSSHDPQVGHEDPDIGPGA